MEWDAIEQGNASVIDAHRRDLEVLAEQLGRRGVDSERVIADVRRFEVAVPSWALGTGGTRFGRFPGAGEPRAIFEKLDDIALIHGLTGATPGVSLHIPWDAPEDPAALRAHAAALGLGFDAVNSNTFQDQPGQARSYKFGSFSHTDAGVRDQAVAHHLEVIEIGQALGSKAITVWLADGSNYPGQMHLRRSFDRVLDCLQRVCARLPADWRLFTEHKPYEPAFYATVVQDWGSSYLLAQALGPRAACLVDLGHHLPNTNIELVVARLIGAGKLGGFHFNDAKYGDDDLTAGSIRPYQLFLVFNELVDAAADGYASGSAADGYASGAAVDGFASGTAAGGFASGVAVDGFASGAVGEVSAAPDPSYMIDQSHNLKDPIEALLQTVGQLQRAYAKALLIDRTALAYHQATNDVLMAESTLQRAFETDVSAIIAEARLRNGGALEPIAAFRASGYRVQKQDERSALTYAPPQSL